ncbi:LOW QUALITY PROTEIN: hypothetical protein M8C21_022464, partial [Ambrosia artemisiifolia]
PLPLNYSIAKPSTLYPLDVVELASSVLGWRLTQLQGFLDDKGTKDIMAKMRNNAVKDFKKATKLGIKKEDPRFFKKISDYPPSHIHLNIWRDMCKIWEKDDRKKKSESGTKNRASTTSTGKGSRHTGGSLGFDEHRTRLKNKIGREPSFREVFLETHLTKESKARLWAGELEINNLNGMDFCTTRAGEIYGEYLNDMKELHGSEFTEDDVNVWKLWRSYDSLIRDRIYRYKLPNDWDPSSSFGVEPSQDKILALENQIQDYEARFEDFESRLQVQREADRKAFEDALKAQREAMQKDFGELIKSYRPTYVSNVSQIEKF